jgi:hypothetical protein
MCLLGVSLPVPWKLEGNVVVAFCQRPYLRGPECEAPIPNLTLAVRFIELCPCVKGGRRIKHFVVAFLFERQQ